MSFSEFNTFCTDRSSKSSLSSKEPICYNELKRLRKSGDVIIIDVRNKSETWRTGVIPGSVCVPFGEIESALNMTPENFEKRYCCKKPFKNDFIMFLCRRGLRSFKAMKQAKKMGYENSRYYQGGFIQWFEQERINREKGSDPKT